MCLQVKGTVVYSEANGAFVEIAAKSPAYLPLQEACIHRIKRVEEAGIYPGLREEFVIIGENEDDSLTLSLRPIQYELAWERCRQLQAEDVVVKGKVGISTPIFHSFICPLHTLRACLIGAYITSKATIKKYFYIETVLKVYNQH